jgi:hypothetical protein
MSEDVPRRDDEGGPRKEPEPTQPVEANEPPAAADPWPDAEPVPGTVPHLPPVDPAATQRQRGIDDTAYDDIRLTPEDLRAPGTGLAGDEPAGTGPSGTGVLPTVPAEPTPPPKWSARAQVRPRGDEDEEVYRQADEWDDRDQPRGLLVPVLIGLVVLLFLALIALGIWLGLSGEEPTPGPSATSASPTVTSPRTTPPPTTATTTTPAEIPIPGLRGQSFAAASKTLTDLGFRVERANEPSLEVQEGQVIGTNPPEGTTLRPGTVITIVVSTGPPEGPPTSAPPTSSPPA